MIGHKIDENELIQIFDQFIDEVVNGDLDEDTTEFLHEIVREMASGHPVYISKGNLANLITDFISMFYFDDKNGGYRFEFNGIIAEGKTTIINVKQ
ncbi:hypothetical protein [Vibrio cholerae]|uniref:hypothetical protein n=1 Tax=Vibrio cholerae TaxID=666 RepID=UPI001E556FBE|nr:hypothetical protein [Vibrio cholerae]MCD1245816.1 hypothetical protein [Vibrio cholerae]